MKPENVLIGRKSHQKRNVLHVIDFGLAKPYIDSETKKHIQFAENRAITGRATIRNQTRNEKVGQNSCYELLCMCSVSTYIATLPLGPKNICPSIKWLTFHFPKIV